MVYTKTTLQLATQLTVTEILDGNVVGLADKSVKHSTLNLKGVFDADSAVPVTKVATFSIPLAAGAATIDLTALEGTNGATVDGTGLKVQAIKMTNPLGNAVITATFGAANPYNLAGAAWSMAVLPGQEFTFYGHNLAPDIAAGAKNIDLAGTLVEELEVSIVMG